MRRRSRWVNVVWRGTVCLALSASTAIAAGAAPAVGDARLVVQPTAVELHGHRDEHGLLVTRIDADGRLTDVTSRCRFTSSQPNVTVTTDGVCRAAGDGRAEIHVECDGLDGRVSVAVADWSDQSSPSFRQDVLPILTKAGCNSGQCHGKLAGQNGFKLSLRGYAPEWDHAWLTRDVSARRVEFAFPEQSLLLRKALGKTPHQGGQRLVEGSHAHQTLIEWIAARAPGPDEKEKDAVRLEILPGGRSLHVGDSQKLIVRAYYENGRVRDVTSMTQFFSNDETTVKVTPEGVASSLRPGETAVRAHFQGQVAVVMFATPYDNDASPASYAARNNFIDDFVFDKLRALHITPSPNCEDAAFLRRAFIDATGAPPSPERVRAFLQDARPDKRDRLIDELLDSPEWVDHWTLQLCDLLQNRKERDHDVRGTKGVRSFQNWMRKQVAANKPWNQIAREVLTASGDSISNPAIGYFITTIGENQDVEKSEAPDAVAQAFLGTRIGCARCHNHPLERYTQDDFYHFAAFFSRVAMKRGDNADQATVLFPETRDERQKEVEITKLETELSELEAKAKEESAEEAAKDIERFVEKAKRLGEVRRELADSRGKTPGVNQPRTNQFLTPRTLDRSAVKLAAGEDPRQKLADWITDSQNENFSGAMVNRIWKHYMGVGMVEPVDDLRSSNPPSNLRLWGALNKAFVDGGYDLKNLMRLIMRSRAYQLSSATLAANEKDTRFYSRYYVRRLPAEVLLDAMSAATGVPDKFAGYPLGTRSEQLPEPGVESYFLGLFGRSDRVTACACERSGDVTLPQLLHLNNGAELVEKIRSADGRLGQLLKDKLPDDQLLDEIFLATVNRQPTRRETDAVKNLLDGGDGREDVYRDLFWALLNSKEFAFNH